MTTFGPNNRPPKVRCVLCEFAIPHEHRGTVPLLPCRACFVGVHSFCDPLTYYCTCLVPECLGER